ncbi:MAG TPA: pantoate--beta-alanine ligase [Bryobacteraceae bacterium]|jgi:pantoate--beta-alanine ligase|nr:pantoate--beta-alanine ligase [Bryobacteraceae bacterium]
MFVWTTAAAWRERRQEFRGQTIGFVPTMGALHGGHASLVERCRAENDIAIVSTFVNPSQFNDPKDLTRYPRTLEEDLRLLENLGVDDVLIPEVSDIYPNGYRFRIEPGREDEVLEGAFRPGFLTGVLTVVMKLLNLVRADRAYFGEKDFQQLRIVTDMAAEFFVPTEIVACPTVREESGLAMSSRNQLLSSDARARSTQLYRAISGAASPADARAVLEAEGFRVDYVEDRWGRRLAAAFLDGVRLIDNVPLGEEPCS